jgi:hypothetical protein
MRLPHGDMNFLSKLSLELRIFGHPVFLSLFFLSAGEQIIRDNDEEDFVSEFIFHERTVDKI